MNKQLDKKILIVDDNPNNIRMLVYLLNEYGQYLISTVNSGHEAIVFLENNSIDLILLDVIMPDIDGFETCRQIKEKEKLKDIPVIFLSAKYDTKDLATGFAVGASDFVRKPFNAVELMARVNTHIELKQSKDLLKTKLENLVKSQVAQLEKENFEKMKLREQLLQSQKMEAVGQLAGGIAHDFNNQLGGIIGSAELIKHFAVDPKVLKYADLILNSAKSSANLTKQLLAFARKGKQTSVFLDINKTILQISQLLERSFDKKIVIVHNFKVEFATTIGDPTLLENAILNIAINAGHAMPNGGTLTFTTSVEELSEQKNLQLPAGNFVCIKIQDTGTGMSPEVMERIFEPFFTTKGKDIGTGLGLSATYGAVKQHNGAISVESELGIGSIFTIYLPLAQGFAENIPNISIPKAVPIFNANILLVDDEEFILTTVSDMLKTFSCTVTTARNGLEGYQVFKKSPDDFDVVILDMVMPKLNGLELFLKIRELRPHVKVVLTSGYNEEQAQKFLDSGVSAFLRKPYTTAEMSQTLTKILGMI